MAPDGVLTTRMRVENDGVHNLPLASASSALNGHTRKP